MAKERRKIMIAGQLWIGSQYRVAHQLDPTNRRSAKAQISAPAKEAANARKSFEKLMLQIACNFRPTDSVITLTYRDACLPRTKEESDKRLSAFVRLFRASRKEAGLELRYIRVTEGYHSFGRFHHHLIINRTVSDIDTIRELWQRNGSDIDIRPLKAGPPPDPFAPKKRAASSPDNFYASWARYLAKEPLEKGRRRVGERMWRASLGMQRPTIIYSNVSESDILAPPPGAFALDTVACNNEFGHFATITAMLPEAPN